MYNDGLPGEYSISAHMYMIDVYIPHKHHTSTGYVITHCPNGQHSIKNKVLRIQ